METANQTTAWEEIGGLVRRESSLPAVASSRASLAHRMSDTHDLVPVDRGEFFECVAPCLTLAAGVGMSQSDQDAWLEAAFQALAGIPIALLKRGAQAAMLKADHPSKILPLVTKEIGEDWQWRKEHRPPAPALTGPLPPRSVCHLLDLSAQRRLGAITAAELGPLNMWLASAGATVRYRPDGSRHNVNEAT